MINFRFHLISIIAVFLALGIGVIMGTAVIDSAVVDRLELQHDDLERRLDDVTSTNDELRGRVRELEGAAEQLAAEGGERLLDGTLRDVSVLVVAMRGIEERSLTDLTALLATADASYRGTLWLTDRFALDDEDETNDLAEALGMSSRTPAAALRTSALDRLGLGLRPLSSAEESDQSTAIIVDALRQGGFVDFTPPQGEGSDALPIVSAGTRILVVSGPGAEGAPVEVGVALAGALLRVDAGRAATGVVVASTSIDEEEPGLVEAMRDDRVLGPRSSTVDDLEDFAGRLAAVLALQDLGVPQFGHYGRGPGAQRLLPAAVAGQ